jgi:hypothetical protein
VATAHDGQLVEEEEEEEVEVVEVDMRSQRTSTLNT